MEFISGNIFVRPMKPHGFEAGEIIAGHAHNFDHTSVFFTGEWRVRRWLPAVREDGTTHQIDGQDAWVLMDDFTRAAPFHILIKANCRHEFTFLGVPVPAWMEPFVAKLSPEDREEFHQLHGLTAGRAWCIYSHRTPQGDVSIDETGWHPAYR